MKNIAIYTAPGKLIERDLNIEFCELMEKNFAVTWITTSRLLKSHYQKNTIFIQKINLLRYRSWLILYELEKFYFRKKNFNGKAAKPHLGLSPFAKNLLNFIILFKFSLLIRKTVSRFLDFSMPNLNLIFKKYDCILFFSSPNDPVYDDIARYFRKYSNNTKIIMIPLNWDNASSKPYIIKPDIVLTWGQQSSELSKKLHSITSIPIGSPRFDHYLTNNIYSKTEAKLKLNLDAKLDYLLFAGASFAFDEIETLNILANYLHDTNRHNYRIIYRPHPYPWPKKEAKKNKNFHSYCIYDTTDQIFEKGDLEMYKILLTASEALITPYSTMILEAAFNGIPTLCLGFNSDLNPEFDWVLNSQSQPHLSFIEREEWIITCHQKTNFEKSINKIFELVGDNTFSKKAKQIFPFLLFQNNLPYVQNLINFLNKV